MNPRIAQQQARIKSSGMLVLRHISVQVYSVLCLGVSLGLVEALNDEYKPLILMSDNHIPEKTAKVMLLSTKLATLLSNTSFFLECGCQFLLCIFLEHRADPSAVRMKKSEANHIRVVGILFRVVSGGMFLGVLITVKVWMSVDAGIIFFYAVGIIVLYLVSIVVWIGYVSAVYSMFSKKKTTAVKTDV